jgi:hypothetical protein
VAGGYRSGTGLGAAPPTRTVHPVPTRRIRCDGATAPIGTDRVVMDMRKILITVTAGLTAAALLTAAPASASATGTAKVRTQRASAPNLASQVGWFEAGEVIELQCSAHGQRVKGYFSFNIPNGGWDDLWYRTTSGHYVADVDIETGTLNSVTPDCATPGGPAPAPAPAPQAAPAPAPAPAPQGSREDRAIAWANGQIGSGAYPFKCGRFVANAYGAQALGVDSALIFRNQLANAGQIHMDQNIPKGALVFSRSSVDQGNGHVVLARGDGTYISGGAEGYTKAAGGTGATVQSMNHWNPARKAEYLGWAYPPGNWPGV